jgi:hypothetical protein
MKRQPRPATYTVMTDDQIAEACKYNAEYVAAASCVDNSIDADGAETRPKKSNVSVQMQWRGHKWILCGST